MTKKDYIKVAQLIKDMQESQKMIKKHNLQSDEYIKGAENCLNTFRREMADIFSDDNPRFDRNRFLVACGYQE